MKPLRIVIDRDLCAACDICRETAPNTFEIDAGAKANVKNPEGDPRDVIIEVAREQGRELARQMGGDGLDRFAAALENWKKGDAYQMDTLESTPERLSFNVTRCRYAEMYRSLGIAEVGALLSCNRDFSLVEGFNPDIALTRTQTIMQGAPHCDFRFVARPAKTSPAG